MRAKITSFGQASENVALPLLAKGASFPSVLFQVSLLPFTFLVVLRNI